MQGAGIVHIVSRQSVILQVGTMQQSLRPHVAAQHDGKLSANLPLSSDCYMGTYGIRVQLCTVVTNSSWHIRALVRDGSRSRSDVSPGMCCPLWRYLQPRSCSLISELQQMTRSNPSQRGVIICLLASQNQIPLLQQSHPPPRFPNGQKLEWLDSKCCIFRRPVRRRYRR